MFIPVKIYMGIALIWQPLAVSTLQWTIWLKICIFHLVYKSMHEFELHQSD